MRRNAEEGRMGFKEPVSLPETKDEKLGGDERISKRSEEKQENWEEEGLDWESWNSSCA